MQTAGEPTGKACANGAAFGRTWRLGAIPFFPVHTHSVPGLPSPSAPRRCPSAPPLCLLTRSAPACGCAWTPTCRSRRSCCSWTTRRGWVGVVGCVVRVCDGGMGGWGSSDGPLGSACVGGKGTAAARLLAAGGLGWMRVGWIGAVGGVRWCVDTSRLCGLTRTGLPASVVGGPCR